MSTLRIDTPFDYPGLDGRPARCLLRVYDQGDGSVVLLATDLGDTNPGASVTNTIERIATEACRRFGLDPAGLTVVEHYDDRRASGAPGIGREDGERFDVVTFALVPEPRSDGTLRPEDRFDHPAWTTIRKAQAEALAGQALP